MARLPSSSVAPTDSTAVLAALAPVARSSVVDAVSKRLQGEILAGRLPPGSRMPSERELSVALGVNRLTLRAALARLEAQGLIVTRHGAPTLVASWRERAGLEMLSSVLESLTAEEPEWHEIVGSLLEVRRVLVSEAVALAAERHQPAAIDQLKRLAAEQRQHLHDALAFAQGEIAFQRALLRAAGNVGLELLLNTFARFPEQHPEMVERLYDRREDAFAFYDMLIEAVEGGGDPQPIRQLVRGALEAVDAAWMQRHGVQPLGAPAAAPHTIGEGP